MNILQGKRIEEEVVGGDSVGGNIAYLLQDNISFLYHVQYTHTLLIFSLSSSNCRPYSQEVVFSSLNLLSINC